jgi:hypothetical protein
MLTILGVWLVGMAVVLVFLVRLLISDFVEAWRERSDRWERVYVNFSPYGKWRRRERG